MFKNMKLGTKIAVGFGALIVIALALGGLATVSMLGVKGTATVLAEQNVPEVAVANNVERWSLTTMYDARGYAYTEEKNFLDKAKGNLEEVKKYLGEAKAHAEKYDLAELRENAETAEKSALEYEGLLNDTVKANEAMAVEKNASLAAADHYMAICAEFLKGQMEHLDQEIGTAMGATTTPPAAGGESQPAPGAESAITEEKLKERIRKTTLCNDVIDLGNAIRLGTWQAIATRDPELFQATEKKFEEVNAKLDELKTITHLEEDLKRIEECRAAGADYLGCMQRFLTEWFAREELNKKRGLAADAVLLAAQNTAEYGMNATQEGSATAASSLATASSIMIGGLSVAVVLGCLLAFFITRSITGPLRRVIDGLNSGAEQVSAASGQVAQSSQSMAEGASEQASSLEETSASLEEMTSMTRQNADNAGQAATLMAQAQEVIGGMAKATDEMSKAIQEIKSSSDETAKIVKTIDEIAFQTNLLALNAAVEAARAGDAGKGFAVVAEEVRNLAQRSAEAAKNTSAMIEGSVKNADNGVVVTQRVAEALKQTVTNAEKVAQLVKEIAAASKEQSQGIDQINTAVSQMDQVTQSNAANAEESASASEELSAQAEQMNVMVRELVAMVGGAGSNGDTVRRPKAALPARRPAVKVASKQAAASLPAPGGSRQSRVVNPETVIPLEDGDLGDF